MPQPAQPYNEDFFQRIVNVNWGGVAFVCGGVKGDVHYIRLGDPQKPQVIRTDLPGAAEIIGGSYGSKDAPAFVLMGVVDDGNGVDSDPTTAIWQSNDGMRWKQVFFDAGPGTTSLSFSYPCAVTYDHDARSFYGALMNGDTKEPSTTTEFFAVILGSQDGAGWGTVSSDTINPSAYRSHFPSRYCKEHDCFDQLNQHVPGGIMSDPVAAPKITMRPQGPPTVDYVGRFTFYAGTSGGSPDDDMRDDPFVSNMIEILTPGEPPRSVELPCAVCFCVAGADSNWLAGGWSTGDWRSAEGVLIYSSDAGETWNVISTGGSGIVCVLAAPSKT